MHDAENTALRRLHGFVQLFAPSPDATTGFVIRALVVGLFGADRFRLTVSADGSTFLDGLSVDNATGIVDQPAATSWQSLWDSVACWPRVSSVFLKTEEDRFSGGTTTRQANILKIN